MQPTPRAAAWVKSARGVLTQIDRDLFVEDRFDPATANRPFVLALSDAGELVIMREDHPVTGTQFVLEEFLQYAHAVVRVPIRNQELIDLHLARRLADHFLALGAPLRKVSCPFLCPWWRFGNIGIRSSTMMRAISGCGRSLRGHFTIRRVRRAAI